jgi:hypothetical protein
MQAGTQSHPAPSRSLHAAAAHASKAACTHYMYTAPPDALMGKQNSIDSRMSSQHGMLLLQPWQPNANEFDISNVRRSCGDGMRYELIQQQCRQAVSC